MESESEVWEMSASWKRDGAVKVPCPDAKKRPIDAESLVDL